MLIMTTKSAKGTARVQPKIKQQAEAIPADIGLPVSVLIDTRESMTDAQFDAMMDKGYRQAKSGQTIPLDEAFAQIREGL